ncbi:MAG: tRNA (uridine(34)/cytosine(34)/5-carboxymethylaminomethyluridine(34)-2'-O)-methyltransferase TrmL [Firmicutes bacterium]|nr:tRNA (uridine(34)/cytosine(34)/5-carboxymethylaminomethyluridine(34)-2'-O)-methyltransferase TrmL [Bacillota bacterium]
MHIVLYNPEIPQNTGNIARTCAVTGTTLHLIKPLGFTVSDRYLKRAGLDYWQYVSVNYWDDINQLRQTYPNNRFYFLSVRGQRQYHTVRYGETDFLVFGSETKGLPAKILRSSWGECIRIPMRAGLRSLNLSNAAALVLYEALRQLDFPEFV